uniref:Group II intron reverse transcriptase/maturase n=1 Tax=Ulva lacinulata TaxID=2806530 RepID=A0A8F0I090_9CHLO|nr:group II intron reverse transcriptase/maturase [Ulva lacinulata]
MWRFSMTDKTTKFYTDEWKGLPWNKFQKNLYRLQHRIYKAAKENDKESIKSLQTLLVGSKCAKYLAARQVTQLNMGKRSAGVDGISKLNPKQRIQLAADLNQLNNWKHEKLRRVYIPKDNGDKRPLGIPTIKDRAMQCLLKYALEPVYEASASNGDFGFRPGHSTWDIQKYIFSNLNSSAKGYKKTIVEIDISKCFDNINHEKLMDLVILPRGLKNALRSALEAGVLTEREKTTSGTPQGGVISPLLANIALHGVEDLQNEKVSSTKSMQRGFRYADDMVFILKEGEDPNKLLLKINEFLKERGLNVNEAKSQTVPATKGFNFLGWHFLVKPGNNKFVSFPSKKNHNAMKMKVKNTVKDTRYPLKDRLLMVKTIYRGWFNYHRYCDMSQLNLWSLHNWVYKYLRKSSKMPQNEIIEHVRDIFTGHNQKVNGFIACKGSKSVYDNDWLYWAKRNNKRFTGPLLTTVVRQDYRCNSCNSWFSTEDLIELHHKDGNNKNNNSANLAALHRHCHQYESIHGEKRKRVIPK